MKVMLISSNMAQTPYPVYPLGMGMVAAALVEAGHEVSQFDLLQHNGSLEALGAAVKRFVPDAVGISIRNIDNVNSVNEQRYVDVVRGVVACVRAVSSAPVILGGAGFSIMPERILAHVQADCGIVGEGERSMVELIAELQKHGSLMSGCRRSTARLSSQDIRTALYDPPILAYYLQSGNMASVQSKRGCPHTCVYCTYPLLEGKDIRPRDPAAVVADMRKLAEGSKAKLIFFTDSVFNDDQGLYLEIVRRIISEKLKVSWSAFFKPDGLTPEAVALMKESGLVAAEIGADAASDTALRGLGKSFLFKDIVSANALFNEQGIATANYFMFGCPGETRGVVREGIANVLGLQKTVSFMFMGIRILPGTPLERIALKEGVIKPGQDLLEPVYYFPPELDRKWLEEELTRGFEGSRTCIFPPDKFESSVQFLHKMGYSGLLWDMLLQGKRKRGAAAAAKE